VIGRLSPRRRPGPNWVPACAGTTIIAALALWSLAATAQISVVDDAGRRIELAQPARRIVSLAPHITEQLFAVGAGERIIATTDFADYPPAARSIARVARAHSVDLERVAAARPDLIIVWGSGFPPATIEALQRMNVPVYVNEPGSLDSIASSLERLARVSGGSLGRATADGLRTHLADLRSRYADRPSVRVFYQIWSQPLMTLGALHVLTEAIRLCGGRSVFENLAPIAPQVSIETVLAADPEIIVTAEPGGKPSGALDAWKRWPQLRAVQRGQLVTLDADRINRHGPRIAAEIEVMCERINAARKSG